MNSEGFKHEMTFIILKYQEMMSSIDYLLEYSSFTIIMIYCDYLLDLAVTFRYSNQLNSIRNDMICSKLIMNNIQ